MRKLNSIHLNHFKNTAEIKAVKLPTPSYVKIPMSMHMGAPCTPTVKKGDKVLVGQKIGDSDAFFSAPIHSSVSGTVKDVVDYRLINGMVCKAVEIETDGEQTHIECSPPEIKDKESFISAVKESGICGLGGAGFPTHIKLSPKTPVDTLIINAAECEPYITADYRLMLERPENVLGGIKLIMKYLEIPKAIIGIEGNKPAAIEQFRKLTENDENIIIHTLPSTYPQGAEKVLIHSTTGRIVMEGQLPSDQGVIVMNVSTAAFIYKYTKTGMPLTNRRITVEGSAVKKPLNVIAPIGTMVTELLRFAEADMDKTDKLIAGGPMMGSCLVSADTPVVKTSNSFLAMTGYQEPKTTACIRCGRCIKACSMNLMPTELEKAYLRKDTAALESLKVNLCMNCGACTYVCPANRKLAETHQLAKAIMPKKKK
ncbi:MAG: electron transport complex subunit RsxC [Oscillospiraceae bacterium]|nr:electron transport complex subunit RsxC [Oscillospiraceae bacterium]